MKTTLFTARCPRAVTPLGPLTPPRMVVLSLACVLAIAGITHSAHAQAPTAASLYGLGVHAYFRGNSSQAEYYLSSALEQNPRDPRYYYFRSLALMRLGRTDEARGDMIAGARLEAREPGRYAVGTALQRVQGADRLLLEQYRRDERAAAENRRSQVQPARHAAAATTDDRFLRRKVVVALDELLPGAGPRLSAAHATTEYHPITPVVEDDPIAQPAAPPAVTEGNPFVDDPASTRAATEATLPVVEAASAESPAEVAPVENGDPAGNGTAEEEPANADDETLFGTGDENPFE